MWIWRPLHGTVECMHTSCVMLLLYTWVCIRMAVYSQRVIAQPVRRLALLGPELEAFPRAGCQCACGGRRRTYRPTTPAARRRPLAVPCRVASALKTNKERGHRRSAGGRSRSSHCAPPPQPAQAGWAGAPPAESPRQRLDTPTGVGCPGSSTRAAGGAGPGPGPRGKAGPGVR